MNTVKLGRVLFIPQIPLGDGCLARVESYSLGGMAYVGVIGYNERFDCPLNFDGLEKLDVDIPDSQKHLHRIEISREGRLTLSVEYIGLHQDSNPVHA
jgi:hypothetical protein